MRIGPGEYLALYAKQFNAEPGNFGLSAYGEEVYLTAVSQDGNISGYSDGGSFCATPVNQALGRYEASDGMIFIPLQRPTFGEDNPGSVEQF